MLAGTPSSGHLSLLRFDFIGEQLRAVVPVVEEQPALAIHVQVMIPDGIIAAEGRHKGLLRLPRSGHGVTVEIDQSKSVIRFARPSA